MRRRIAIAFLASALILCTALYAVGESLVNGIYSEEITKKDIQLIIPEHESGIMARAPAMTKAGTGTVDLPIWGMSFNVKADAATGDVWMVYNEGGRYSPSQVAIFNLKTMERVAVPDASAKYGFFKTGLAVRNGIVHVSWSPDNMHIMYRSYNTATKAWSSAEQVYRDQHYPNVNESDTNFSDLAVADDGTLMCIFCADFSMMSKHKKTGQGWSGMQYVFPPNSSEARCPSVQPWQNGFVATYTCIMSPNKGSVGVSKWNGNWSQSNGQAWPEYSFNDINEAWPDSPSCFLDQNGNVYSSWVLWEKSTQKYSKIGFGQNVNGAISQKTWSTVYAGSDVEHPTMSPVAVDKSGNVVFGDFNFVTSNQQSFIYTREAGKDWVRSDKGDVAEIGLTYNPEDKYFYLVYVNGSTKLETFSFEDNTPTPTPTPHASPTSVPQWDVFEVALYTSRNYGNAFKDEKLFGWFAEPGTQMPSGECKGSGCHAVEGVYDGTENGKHKFILRFRPDKKGTWTYTTFSATGNSDLRIAKKSLEVSDPREVNHGPMRREGKFIVHADGTPHQHLGGTAFGVLWKGPWQQFLQRYIDKGVTYFRIGFWITWGRGCNGQQGGYGGCCDEAKINGCWLGIWPYEFWAYPQNPNPDWSRMNISQFRKLDGVLDYLLERGCYAEVLLYDSTINASMQEYGSPHGYLAGDARQKNYLDYIAKRYKAYPNFWYELGNEVRHSTGPDKMKPSHDWVFWVFDTIKSHDPDRLLAYEAPGASVNYQDPGWSWDPEFHYVWSHTIAQGSHREILESPICDIINIHTARGGEWWQAGPLQMEYLSKTFNKPVNNDEPHRKGYYGLPCEDWQIRRSAWLTAMVGNAYYTIHGVSMGDFCRACIEDGDLGANMSKHFTKFWNKLGMYNFERDNSLYEGSGGNKRAMHKNNVYVYYVEDGNGWVKFKTLKKMKYELYVMDTATGEVIAEQIKDSQNPTVDVGGKRDFAAFLRPYSPPPTPTPTPSPSPTPTPGNGHGGIGCLCAHLSYADDGSEWTAADEAADIAPTVLLVVLLIGVVGYIRRFL